MTRRIWVSISTYAPSFSGAAVQVDRVLERLSSKGFSATVLTSGDLAASSLRGQEVNKHYATIKYLPVIPPRQWKSTINLRHTWLQKLWGYLTGLLHSLSRNVLAALVIWHNGQQGDILEFQSFDTFSILLLWIARVRHMHSVVHLNLLGSDDPCSLAQRLKKGHIDKALPLAAFRRVERIVSITTALTASCRDYGISEKKIVQIPHGVDAHEFRPLSSDEKTALRIRLGLVPNRPHIVFVGAATPRKGIDVLLRAYLRVRREVENIELLIVGPNDFSEGSFANPVEARQIVKELQDEMAQAGCSSQVHWIGKVNNVRDYMQAADVFCLPTRREGFGIVLIEAMAAGLPVIAGCIEGVTTDIVTCDRHGILIRGYDPEDYAQALLRVLQDRFLAKAMGDAARERVVSKFSLDRVVDLRALLYAHLAEGL